MDFLKKFAETNISKAEESTEKPSSEPAAAAADHQSSNPSDLFSSAKLVAEAARSTIQKEEPKYDNAEVAGAAADLLDAAQTYGKLDKTSGVGSYIEKAETYLHEYETSNKPKTVPPPEAPKTEEKEAPKTEDSPVKEETKTETEEAVKTETEEAPKEEVKEEIPSEPAKPTTTEEPKSEIPSEVGEYAKIAEGFLSKQSEGTGESEKSGLGDVAKLAGGFFK
ncbi:OLC1v1032661C1 [Oldenlandia corymbosa var. corymbosa]|uniref:OLC1v1032661C1 n=1 Tax=Oldenlandia corymbosa var. corymbosa TaxID=529605 RepID=A0AAV1CLC3_OLDCO|nr:OLC1v1032661C1 [Oldenlandia corymbosa var. corymbosa]